MATHQPALLLGREDHGRPTSAEEFASAELAEPWSYEREGGRLIVMAPDGEEHDDISEPWRDRLGVYRLANPRIVEKVVSEAWILVDGGTDRICDIAVYLWSEQPAVPRPHRVPELVVEVVSPGKEGYERDYITKRREYYRLGVREYVVIDRFARTVTVFTRGARGFQKRVLTSAQTYTSPLLPGFEIRLADVF